MTFCAQAGTWSGDKWLQKESYFVELEDCEVSFVMKRFRDPNHVQIIVKPSRCQFLGQSNSVKCTQLSGCFKLIVKSDNWVLEEICRRCKPKPPMNLDDGSDVDSVITFMSKLSIPSIPEAPQLPVHSPDGPQTFAIIRERDTDDPLIEVRDILENPIDVTQTKSENIKILQQIRKHFESLLKANSEGQPMTLEVPSVKKWTDCKVTDGKLSRTESKAMKVVSSDDKRQLRSLTVIISVLCKVYINLAENDTTTKRGIFYANVAFFKNQDSVDRAIDAICAMLNVHMHELSVFATSKGFIAGNLTFQVEGHVLDCKYDNRPRIHQKSNHSPQLPSTFS